MAETRLLNEEEKRQFAELSPASELRGLVIANLFGGLMLFGVLLAATSAFWNLTAPYLELPPFESIKAELFIIYLVLTAAIIALFFLEILARFYVRRHVQPSTAGSGKRRGSR